MECRVHLFGVEDHGVPVDDAVSPNELMMKCGSKLSFNVKVECISVNFRLSEESQV